MAFTGRLTVEVQSGQISGTLTNFAFTIIAQHNDLKLIANGGTVTQKEEIRVFSDPTLTAAIPFYRLFYDGTAGLFIADVLIASAADGSKCYVGFGDASLTSEASSTSAYSTDFSAVLPMTDGTTLSVADVSQAGNNGTNNGATAGSGAIGSGAASFDGTNDYIKIPDFYVSFLTVSCIINTTVNNTTKVVAAKRNGMTGETPTGDEDWLVYVNGSGKIQFSTNTGVSAGVLNNTLLSATTLSTGTSYVLHATYDGTTANIYLDGALDATASWSGVLYNGGNPIHIGDDGTAGRFWSGTQQFFRIVGYGRTAAWVAAEAQMWRNPSTFASYTFDAAPGGGGGGPLIGGSLTKGALIRGGRLVAA